MKHFRYSHDKIKSKLNNSITRHRTEVSTIPSCKETSSRKQLRKSINHSCPGKKMIEGCDVFPQLKYHIQAHSIRKQQSKTHQQIIQKQLNRSSIHNHKNAARQDPDKSLNKRYSNFELPYEIGVEVKHIHSNMEALKEMGFSEGNITKWLLSFLSNKSQTLKAGFLKSFRNKKSLVDAYVFERENNLEISLEKLRMMLARASESEVLFLKNQVKDLRRHIEDIIIHKTEIKLDDIANCPDGGTSGERWAIRPPSRKICSDFVHFIKDLKSMESRYGELTYISRLNRAKFDKIQEAEEKLLGRYKFSQ